LLVAAIARCDAQVSQQPSPAHTPDPVSIRQSLDRGDLVAAESNARAYLAANQSSADAHFLMGLVLFRRGDARASLAEYTQGARYKTPTAFDLLIVGSDYVELGDFSDADRWLTKCVEFDPENVTGWYYLGRTKYNENRFEEAISAFQHCLRLDPKHVKAEDNLGLSFQAVQRTEDATRCFQNAMDWQSGKSPDPGPYIDMGALLIEENRNADALPYLQRAVAIAPEEGRAHQQLGKALFKLDRLGEAQIELEKAEQLTPGSAPLHYMLGQVYRKQNLSDKAQREFQNYSRLSGTHSTSTTPEPGRVQTHVQ
jgi:tetratricopeptide (TPR) repeat protein